MRDCRQVAFAPALLALFAAGGCGGVVDDVALQPPSPIYKGVAVSRCALTNVVALDNRCSGVVLHPELVVYAAHCGETVSAVRAGDQEIATRECHALPGHALGGTDIAYCRLARPIPVDIDIIAPAAGCELDGLRPGAAVTMAGYGGDSPDGQYGVRRVSQGVIGAIERDDIVVGGAGAGLCPGDSGGPLFLPVSDAAGRPSLRVVGIASASPAGPCGESPSHYVRLAAHLDWLEASTGLDLTPCGDPDGQWRPNPACLAIPAATPTSCDERPMSRTPSQTCGAAFDPGPADVMPPHIAIVSADTDSDGIDVAVDASDAGWGLREVRVELRDSVGRTVWWESRSLSPFAFRAPPLPAPGTYLLWARAMDHAQLVASVERTIEVPDAPAADGGCQVGGRGGRTASWLAAGLLLMWVWSPAGCSRRRGTRSRSSPAARAVPTSGR